VGVKLFDRKFGAELVASLPSSPGIYLFRDDGGRVLYVGKAVNLRKRLAGYRNASRRKAHRKMRLLVRAATTLEVRRLDSEREALLAENQLIQSLRPPHNVDGAYSFLYPAIGLCRAGHLDLFCFTTQPEQFGDFEFQWFGAFRSRPRAKEAFDVLIETLCLLAHPEPRSRVPSHPRPRGSRLVAFRRLDAALRRELEAFLAGESLAPLGRLAEHLLEKPRARRDAERVEECLHVLRAFYETDLRKLRDALRTAGIRGTFIHRNRRDALFIGV
jgi:excinuclease ABC subunit C